MGPLLWRMRDTAQQYVEILREILGNDASIFDDQQLLHCRQRPDAGADGPHDVLWKCVKHARNVYAKTEAECEERSKALIREMKAEIVQAREKVKAS